MLPSGTPEVSKPSPATPGPISEVNSGHLPKFLHGWLAFSPFPLMSHRSLWSPCLPLFQYISQVNLKVLPQYVSPTIGCWLFIDLSKTK